MLMSWLYLDTHAPRTSTYGWFEHGRVKVRTYEERAPFLLTGLVREARLRKKHLEGVCVVSGPGSFSAVRVGVVYANLLARLWHVPLVEIIVDQAADLPHVAREIAAFSTTRVAIPLYDAEPNITLPKNKESQIKHSV